MNDNKVKTLLPPLLSSILAWVLYELTNANGLYWGDSGEFVTVSKIMGIGHSYGHPLFWLLGRMGTLFFPSNPAAGVNHMIAFSAASTIFILAMLISDHLGENRNLLDRLIITFTAVGIYATGTTVWVQATYAEVYHLHAVMIVLFLFCLDKYFFQRGSVAWLAGAAYFFGLAFTLGQYAALLLLLIPLFALTGVRNLKIGISEILILLLSFGVGLSIWIYLPIRSALDPPVHSALIDSMASFMDYLTRADYQGWIPASWIAVPFSLKQAGLIWVGNLSIFGVILIAIWIITLYRNRDLRAIPWFLGSLFYIAFCGLLIPLTMTAVQMNEMDVYLIPALILAIPVVAAGIQVLIPVMRARLRPLLILPVVLLIILNWPKADISDTNEADRFVDYLGAILPDSVRIMPTTDNIIFPLWYLKNVEENPKGFIIEPNLVSEMTPENSTDFIGETPLLIQMDGPFYDALLFLDEPTLAGPFAAFHVDQKTTSRIDSTFLRNFSFQVEAVKHLTQLDRLSIAKFWYNRARYFFIRWQMLPATHRDRERFWQQAIAAYTQTALLDNFSSIGAETRARLALMHVNLGRSEEGTALVYEAIRISPMVNEAYRALFSIAYTRRDYGVAIKQLKRLIRLEPDNGNIWMDLAFCYDKNSQLDQARKSYKKGLTLGAAPQKSLEAKLNIH
ncbi:DUF2723 domain-containing protein [candidate division KSB1 bacterium]|nr:DUF2723 domain-containing protein [candidate division KSB1 bacterium]